MRHDDSCSNFLAHECMQKLNRLLGHPTDALCFDGIDSYFIDMNECAALCIPKNSLGLSAFGIWQLKCEAAITFTGVRRKFCFDALIEAVKCNALHMSVDDAIHVAAKECLIVNMIEFCVDENGTCCATEFHNNEKMRDFKFDAVDEIARIIFESLKADCEKIFEVKAKLRKELKKDELKKEGMKFE